MDRKNKRRLKPSECEACPPGTAFFTPKKPKNHNQAPHRLPPTRRRPKITSLCWKPPETAKAAPFRHYGAASHIKTRQK
ncbi:hypothetical protein [Neisseria meningitidis]|uniref:hypothetical protein n=1 Tax=Neisseria meningitidis TaxID=487 RepID=UPI00077B18D7|nr:hypothetical protein [Neisseria meningitidis]